MECCSTFIRDLSTIRNDYIKLIENLNKTIASPDQPIPLFLPPANQFLNHSYTSSLPPPMMHRPDSREVYETTMKAIAMPVSDWRVIMASDKVQSLILVGSIVKALEQIVSTRYVNEAHIEEIL